MCHTAYLLSATSAALSPRGCTSASLGKRRLHQQSTFELVSVPKADCAARRMLGCHLVNWATKHGSGRAESCSLQQARRLTNWNDLRAIMHNAICLCLPLFREYSAGSHKVVALKLLLCFLISSLLIPLKLPSYFLSCFSGLSRHWDLAIGRCLAGLDAVDGCNRHTCQINVGCFQHLLRWLEPTPGYLSSPLLDRGQGQGTGGAHG